LQLRFHVGNFPFKLLDPIEESAFIDRGLSIRNKRRPRKECDKTKGNCES
jgi:hypothetical protein